MTMIGQTISHYAILSKLGEGGGVVYRAHDTKLDRTVALKFLSARVMGSQECKARFLHEARSAAALSHPNLCAVYEIDDLEDFPTIRFPAAIGRHHLRARGA